MAEQYKSKTIYHGDGTSVLGSYIVGSDIYLDCDFLDGGGSTSNGYAVTATVQKWTGSYWQNIESKSSWYTQPSRVTLGFYGYGRYGNTLRITLRLTPGLASGGSFLTTGGGTYYNMSSFIM